MGGPGSTRWHGYDKKLTVEQCSFIDIYEIIREIQRGQTEISVFKPAGMPWHMHGLSKKVGSVGAELKRVGNGGLILNLGYTVNIDGADQSVFETIRLESTLLCSGGYRWWFSCPRGFDNIHCHRRVQKLYLPPGCLYFGCRHCYDLTYMSSQNPEARIKMPNLVRQFLSGPGYRDKRLAGLLE